MTSTSRLSIGVLSAAFALAAGCGKGEEKGAAKAPPEKPYTGAPVAFVVTRVAPDGLDVDVYNFSDKKVAQYGILMRYYDASGQVLKVKPGTAFEKDHDFWSMSGRKFAVEPKSWASFRIDHLEVPAGAVKAEVLASRVTALAADGVKFEEQPLFELPGMDWPEPPGGAAPPAAGAP
jgi:hypothetical protein